MKIMLDDGACMPERAHKNDAGLDLLAMNDVSVPANSRKTIETGVHVEIPEGYVGLLTSKSGLMRKHGITTRGTIDCGYVGTIQVVFFNNGDTDYQVKRGDKISQLVILPIITPELELVDELDDTERGDGGFGSTGR